MSVGYRGGSTDEVWSILRQTIEAGFAAAAFVVTKMRPALVAAHTTLVSDGDGVLIETCPPERSSPHGYGPGHATVQRAFGGLPGAGHSAAGPYVSRPGWPGSPIAFQSSQTSIAGS